MIPDDRAELEIDEHNRLADRGRAESAIGRHRMIVCNLCGNKRCPHANDINNACTGSNESGQPGSAYPSHPLTEPAGENDRGHLPAWTPEKVAAFNEWTPRKTQNLWQLSGDILALDALADETGGEFSAEEEAAWVAMGDTLFADEAAKVDLHYQWIRKLESEASAQRAEAEQYIKRAVVRENRVKRIKAMWKLHLEATGRKKVESATGRVIAIQSNGGVRGVSVRDGINLEDLQATNPELVVVKREPNREAMRKRMESEGIDEIPGVAELIPRGTSLRIK